MEPQRRPPRRARPATFRPGASLPGVAHGDWDELAHQRVKLVLRFEADAGPVGKPQPAVVDFRVVGEACERAEHVGIRFAAAEAEAADDVRASSGCRRAGIWIARFQPCLSSIASVRENCTMP